MEESRQSPDTAAPPVDATAEHESVTICCEVVSRFAHRLRSMLTSVGAAADFVLNNEIDGPAREEMLSIISEQSGRIEALLEDFMVVAGNADVPDRPAAVVDLYHVAREAVRDLAVEAQSLGAWLVLDAAGGPSSVHGDRSLLRQAVTASLRAILNLTRPGDRVVARLRRHADRGSSPAIELAVTLETHRVRRCGAMAAINPTDLSLDAARRICECHGGSFSLMEDQPGIVWLLPVAPLTNGPLTSTGNAPPGTARVRCVGT